MNSATGQADFFNIYKTYHTTITEHILLWHTWNIPEDHILGHDTNVKCKTFEIISEYAL